MRAVFSSRFKADLAKEEAKYEAASPNLGKRLRKRVAEEAKEIIRKNGGDHIGPHGHPCRRPSPFPYYIYYAIRGDTLYFLALVHERRHPHFLKQRKSE